MPRSIQPATDSKTVPVVRSAVYDTAETFIKGAVLTTNGDGEVVECTTGAGVAEVVGVALEGVGTKPGHNVANDNLVVFRTGVVNEVSMVDLVKNRNQIFSARLTDASGDNVLPTQDHVLESRGLLLLADGTWTVNDDNETDESVQIVNIVLLEGSQAAGNYVLFRFLDAVLAITADIS
jgi:hypothetical protein